ncbi:aldo/keto reductase, partial [Pseudomonas aeruginosa]|uniref:aldo/keto reductase n=1 Tax=Pseudomonas aeruginosa TaxID=287 RepID=UPI0031B671D4
MFGIVTANTDYFNDAAYKNEEGVGKALKNASVNREELFITTKLWNDDHKRPREALLDSLKKLQLDYIDL